MNKIVLTIVTLGLIALLTVGTFAQTSSDNSATASSGAGDGSIRRLDMTHFKTCSYPWDSTPYIGKEVKITAAIRDSAGNHDSDSVEVQVVEEARERSSGGHPMTGDRLEIQITHPKGGEVAGDVDIKATARGPYKMEDMSLAFETDEIGQSFSIPDSYCESGGTVPRPLQRMKVSINPEKQYSKDGTASYKVIVKDLHPQIAVICEESSDSCITPPQKEYKYELDFSSKQGLRGSFDKNTIFLRAGEAKSVELKVKTTGDVPEKIVEDVRVFIVSVEGEDAKARAKGLLILKENPKPNPAFFAGQGFAINEDGSEGRLVSLHIVKKGDHLKGKMSFGKEGFRIDGTVSNGDIEFSLYKLRDGSVSSCVEKYIEPYWGQTCQSTDTECLARDVNGDGSVNGADLGLIAPFVRACGNPSKVGEFSGEVKKFDRFLLLRGDLEFEIYTYPNQKWALTAISKQKPLFVEIEAEEISEGSVVTTGIDEVVTIKEKIRDVADQVEKQEETHVFVTGVRKARIFGLIPKFWSNKKEAKVEIIKPDGETIRKTVEEEKEIEVKTETERYIISVGSLQDTENIPVTVTTSETS